MVLDQIKFFIYRLIYCRGLDHDKAIELAENTIKESQIPCAAEYLIPIWKDVLRKMLICKERETLRNKLIEEINRMIAEAPSEIKLDELTEEAIWIKYIAMKYYIKKYIVSPKKYGDKVLEEFLHAFCGDIRTDVFVDKIVELNIMTADEVRLSAEKAGTGEREIKKMLREAKKVKAILEKEGKEEKKETAEKEKKESEKEESKEEAVEVDTY